MEDLIQFLTNIVSIIVISAACGVLSSIYLVDMAIKHHIQQEIKCGENHE